MKLNLHDPLAVAALIDHTSLKPETTMDEVVQLCSEADQVSFASVCVNPYWVSLCRDRLSGSAVRICTVIGFPLGSNTVETKVAEAKQALSHGASELDMVMNVGAFRSGRHAAVASEIEQLSELVHSQAGRLKVILETCLLNDGEIIAASRIAAAARADFVKTSTGFSKAGATVSHIKLMREAVGAAVGVKASGGVRDFSTLRAMVEAGASRIGTSSGMAILREITGPVAADSAAPAGY